MRCCWCLRTSRILQAVSPILQLCQFVSNFGLCADLSPEEITNALQLNKLKDRLWYVVPSVATEGTGIFEGLVSILKMFAVYIHTDLLGLAVE